MDRVVRMAATFIGRSSRRARTLSGEAGHPGKPEARMRLIRSLAVVVVTQMAWAVAAAPQDPATAAPTRPGPATRPFAISKETTYFTAPVRADGTIDYVA